MCAGGRYDGLVEELGGQHTPALGFGLGMERLLLLLQAQGVELPGVEPCEVFLGYLGDAAKAAAFRLCTELWKSGVHAMCDVNGRGLKAQMKYADKLGAEYTAVLGDNEIETGEVNVKNMTTGEQTAVKLGALAGYLK